MDRPLAARARRSVLRKAALLLLVVVAGLALITLLQHRLLYFPARASVAQMAAGGLVPWPSATDFRGLLAERTARPPRATVIVFHGNAGHAGHRSGYAGTLVPLGFRVILAEYPGYGPRSGGLGESSLVGDATRTIDAARHQFGPPVLVIGESLGSGVAAAAAGQRRDHVAGLLLLTPWDRLAGVAAHHYPLLPVRWLLRDRYDSSAALAEFGRPVVIAVAEDDAVVPARFGFALHQALGGPKRLESIAGAAHNDWMTRVDSAWWRRTTDFLLEGGR